MHLNAICQERGNMGSNSARRVLADSVVSIAYQWCTVQVTAASTRKRAGGSGGQIIGQTAGHGLVPLTRTNTLVLVPQADGDSGAAASEDDPSGPVVKVGGAEGSESASSSSSNDRLVLQGHAQGLKGGAASGGGPSGKMGVETSADLKPQHRKLGLGNAG